MMMRTFFVVLKKSAVDYIMVVKCSNSRNAEMNGQAGQYNGAETRTIIHRP